MKTSFRQTRVERHMREREWLVIREYHSFTPYWVFRWSNPSLPFHGVLILFFYVSRASQTRRGRVSDPARRLVKEPPCLLGSGRKIVPRELMLSHPLVELTWSTRTVMEVRSHHKIVILRFDVSIMSNTVMLVHENDECTNDDIKLI